MPASVIIPRSPTNTTRLRPKRSLSANQATFRTLHDSRPCRSARPSGSDLRNETSDGEPAARRALPDGDHSMTIFGATRLIPAPT
jgi:hypothetical protein